LSNANNLIALENSLKVSCILHVRETRSKIYFQFGAGFIERGKVGDRLEIKSEEPFSPLVETQKSSRMNRVIETQYGGDAPQVNETFNKRNTEIK
jgi:hypothetical protein